MDHNEDEKNRSNKDESSKLSNSGIDKSKESGAFNENEDDKT